MNKPVRIYLIDDHKIMRAGLSLLLRRPDMTIVGQSGDAGTAFQGIGELLPDLLVMDLHIGKDCGVSLTRRVRAAYPEIRIVVLTAHAEPELVNEALRAGANGLVFKSNAETELIQAVRTAMSGGMFLSPEAAAIVVRELQTNSREAPAAPGLSDRETQVLRGIAEGQSTKEIAFALKVSPKTVEAQRAKLMAKLAVTGVAGLTKHALRLGLTKL